MSQPWATERQLADLPDRHGLAGAYAGVSNGALIVAGGTNFPDKMPWEKGIKVWHDKIHVLTSPDGAWKSGFKLPRPLAYGASVNCPQGVLCIGGGDGIEASKDVFLMQWEGGTVKFEKRADLPVALAGCSAAMLGDRVYVAGGSKGTDAAAQASERLFYSLDLSNAGASWQSLDAWPGPERFYAVVGATGDSIFLLSGMRRGIDADGKPKLHCLADGYRYTPGCDGKAGAWSRIADLPTAHAAAPTPAAWIDSRWLTIVGGGVDDTDLARPMEQRGNFRKAITAYDTKTGRWGEVGAVSESCVAVPLVQWNDQWIVPTGEIRAGVRSPRVRTYRW